MKDAAPVDALLRVFNNLKGLERQIDTERQRLQQNAEDQVFDAVAGANKMEEKLSRLLDRASEAIAQLSKDAERWLTCIEADLNKEDAAFYQAMAKLETQLCIQAEVLRIVQMKVLLPKPLHPEILVAWSEMEEILARSRSGNSNERDILFLQNASAKVLKLALESIDV
ncbi:hypothetical protein BT96DRAFT_926912 [Gymnopus androsaceus JB14]|uniref:Uncharacterized protein n=1 Tax=Gymnopus androsaceus JB14 TaxID=1447944 RepID=A0A6A4GSE3_9AGAR|nr:hypothetical protein BT96DRAFT_926912 [Gymnopus androsaceus JB14]